MIIPELCFRNNGVPIIKDTEIEMHAIDLLKDYNLSLLKEPQQLDVDDFAESYMQLNLDYQNLSHNGFIWGRMVYDNRQIPVLNEKLLRAEFYPVKANTILIDNSLLENNKENAYRSTVVHECAHSLYHPIYFEMNGYESQGTTACRESDINGSKKNDSGKHKLETDMDWIEHHAKYFSAAILMPKPAMMIAVKNWQERYEETEKEYSNYGFDNLCKDFVNTLPSYIAETFKVSERSACIRLEQLKLNIHQKESKYPLSNIVALF